jgi:phosphate transport system protein
MIDKSSLGKHISQQFNQELEDIRQKVLTMGGLVEQNITTSIQALVSGRADDMSGMKAEDRKVNLLEVFIDESVTQIIARRQPTASDLRVVLAVSRTIVDLERIGDEAKKVYKMATKLADEHEQFRALAEAENLGNHVKAMLHDALDAFARLDAKAALEVAREDRKVDQEHEEIMRLNMTYMLEDARNIRRAVNLMWAARALERIGDHARNIAEHTIYMITGKDIRYQKLDHAEQAIAED